MQQPVLMEEKASILVVDDDEANRESLRRRLQRQGFEVASASNGTEALQRIDGANFDLVVLDVMMPGISGLEVLKTIRLTRNATQLPVIMATARDQSEDVVSALKMGASDYVTKPLDFQIVLARVQTQLELRKSVRQVLRLEKILTDRNEELEKANAQLTMAADQMRRDLEAAARVQAALLPQSAPRMRGVTFAWAFEPSQELAGDSLNVLKLTEDCAALYVLDVSGHGVAASLLAVAATRLLLADRDGDSMLVRRDETGVPLPASPRQVITGLDQQLPWNDDVQQYLTFLYGTLNGRTHEFAYCTAGHPPPIYVPREGEPRVLSGSGLPIGIQLVHEPYEQISMQLNKGDRIYFYSDGVTEAMNGSMDLFGIDRALSSLKAGAGEPLQQSIGRLIEDLHAWQADVRGRDDISVAAVECA